MDNRREYTQEEMESIRAAGTSGFYKVDPDGTTLLFGRFYVLNAEYELHRHLHGTYTYPVAGWSWYESEEEARLALNCPLPKTAQEIAEETRAQLAATGQFTDAQIDAMLSALNT